MATPIAIDNTTSDGTNVTGTSTTTNQNMSRTFCLDLSGTNASGKEGSSLRQYHQLTFVFSNSNNTSQGKSIITAGLPEKFSYNIGGVWNNSIKLGGDDLLNTLSATVLKTSTSMVIDNSQFWVGTKPLKMVFSIPIFDDAQAGSGINYQEALSLFSEAVLPDVNSSGFYNSIPGPDIFSVLKGYKGTKEVKAGLNRVGLAEGTGRLWDHITLQIGGILLVDWCFIEDIKVSFPNTKSMIKHTYDGVATLRPLLAQFDITVGTVKGVTMSNFKNMLQLKEQTTDMNYTNNVSQDNSASLARQVSVEAYSNYKASLEQ